MESLSPTLPKIHSDEGLLSRAIMSLLENAIIFIPDKEKVFLSTSKGDDYLIVTMRYRGEELLKDDLEQFFPPIHKEG